jgi:hypothetical protein
LAKLVRATANLIKSRIELSEEDLIELKETALAKIGGDTRLKGIYDEILTIATAVHASHPEKFSENPMQVYVAASQAILSGPVSYV